jgi:carbon-monoxide dehydrogenase medium subunit
VDAKSRIEQFGHEAKLLAGGQSLIPGMNFRLNTPAVLIDINEINGLAEIIETDDGGLLIGALTRQSQAEHDAQIAVRAPLLAEALPLIAHPQIRNRGTLGGSLAHADPAAELPVVMTALDARFKLESAHGERWVAAKDFFQFIYMTDLGPDEILTQIEIPPSPPKTGWAFLEFARRDGDYALAGAAARITLDPQGQVDSARLVYLNLGPTPMDAESAASSLVGATAASADFKQVASDAAAHEIDPIENMHAPLAYQRHLAGVIGERALTLAAERAMETLA